MAAILAQEALLDQVVLPVLARADWMDAFLALESLIDQQDLPLLDSDFVPSLPSMSSVLPSLPPLMFSPPTSTSSVPLADSLTTLLDEVSLTDSSFPSSTLVSNSVPLAQEALLDDV